MTEANEITNSPAAPRFVEKARSEVVNLEWPIEYDRTVYRAVEVSRMTVGQIESFFAQFNNLNENDPEAARRLRFPMFSAPDAVMDALDHDDHVRIQEAVSRFLPRAFQGEAPSAPGPQTGEPSR
jgi:hypothetical protein